MGVTRSKDAAMAWWAGRGPGRRPLVAGALGAALATASSASVGTFAASTDVHPPAGPVTIAWSGSPLAGASADPRQPGPPPPPSWTGGVLPSARHGQSVGEQLQGHHPDRRARAAADVFGTAALHGDLPASMRGAVAGIPAIVLDAYRTAASRMQQQDPRCGVPWWLLAGIGRIESGHAAGGRVDAAGTTRGTILGPRLDGTIPGTFVISDSDNGALDGDPDYDRAVGPMQFLPSTWAAVAADGNGDGVKNPNNVYDASLGAARYLCAGGGNLRTVSGLTEAVLRYNASMSYVRSVLTWGMAYRDKVSIARAAPGRVPSGDPRLPAVTPRPEPRHQEREHGPRVVAGGPVAEGHRGGGGQNGSGALGGSGGAAGGGGAGASSPAPSGSGPSATPTGKGKALPTPVPTGTQVSPPTGTQVPPPTSPPASTPGGSGTSATTTGPGGTTAPPPTTPAPSPSTSPSPSSTTSEVGTVSGQVWDDDQNPNGIHDGDEPGINGVQVDLLNSDGVVMGSMQTEPNPDDPAELGDYWFTAVDAGDYMIRFTLLEPLASVAGFAGEPAETANTTTSAVFSVSSGSSVQIGAAVVTTDVSGTAYQDLDGSGTRNDVGGSLEPAASQSVTVALTPASPDGSQVAGAQSVTRTTGPDGSYDFDDVQPGTYLLTVTTGTDTTISEPSDGQELIQVGRGTRQHFDLGLEPPAQP